MLHLCFGLTRVACIFIYLIILGTTGLIREWRLG
jgi:hypothetical protein